MSQWIPVLVRLEDYDEITQLVASREAVRGADDTIVVELRESEDRARPEEDKLDRRVSWSLEDLKLLAEGRTLTAQRWTRAMDVCVQGRENGEIWMPTSKVAQRAGMDVNEWRDAPRKITRHLKAQFPNVPKDHNGDHFWPLCPGGGDIPANGGEVWWAITEDMAKRWRQVRGEDVR